MPKGGSAIYTHKTYIELSVEDNFGAPMTMHKLSESNKNEPEPSRYVKSLFTNGLAKYLANFHANLKNSLATTSMVHVKIMLIKLNAKTTEIKFENLSRFEIGLSLHMLKIP